MAFHGTSQYEFAYRAAAPSYFHLTHANTMTTYARNPEMIERHIRGEHILVPLARTDKALDSLYVLNKTAGIVWQHAADGMDHSEIIAAIRREFEVDDTTATADVQRILSELVDIGALTSQPGKP